MITEKQKDIAYQRIMAEIRQKVCENMEQSDGLWLTQRLSDEETREFPRQGQEIIKDSAPEFMV